MLSLINNYFFASLCFIIILSLYGCVYILTLINKLTVSVNKLLKAQALTSHQLEGLSSYNVPNAVELTQNVNVAAWLAPLLFFGTILIVFYLLKSSSSYCVIAPAPSISQDFYVQTVQNISKDRINSLDMNTSRVIPKLDVEFEIDYLNSFSLSEELGFKPVSLLDHVVNTSVEVLVVL